MNSIHLPIQLPARRFRRIAFQGEPGAFSHLAIQQLVGPQAEPIPCQRFEEMFRAVLDGKAGAAMVPVENTLHGSVHENYDLLLKFRLPIVAETNVRIVHNLIALPGVKFRDIRRVYSHPVALNQCLDFFKQNPQVEKLAWYDTAGSIKMLSEQKPTDAAGIASSLAAQTYGCRILKKGIEDDRQNFTRFFLVAPKALRLDAVPRGYKTSLVVTMPNVAGSLFKALAALALRNISLCKLETRPWKGKRWEYLYYIDFLGDVREENVQNALRHLGEVTDSLVVLGCYPRGD